MDKLSDEYLNRTLLVKNGLKNEKKKFGKSAWNMKQKIRTTQIMMSRLNIKGTDKEQVLKIIKDIVDFKELCRNCSCETIITAICFFIIKTNNSSRNIKNYKILKEYELSDSKCLVIFARIGRFYQKIHYSRCGISLKSFGASPSISASTPSVFLFKR